MLIRKILHTKAGFTLIEVIISIAIIGVIAVTFLGAFSNAFINIIHGGQRSIAAEKAQKIIDLIYESESTDPTVISGFASGIVKKDSYNELVNDVYSGESSRYYIENIIEPAPLTGIVNKKATVLVYYNNGKNYVIITSFVP